MSCSLNLRNLSYKRSNNLLWENIDLNVGHKDKIAIVGANGSGKTTLLQIIAGLEMPTSGEVELFHNKMSSKADFKKVRADVGYLFQDPDDQFIAPTVIEDVAFGLLVQGEKKDIAFDKAKEILKDLDISHLEEKIVFHLSGGEKKQVALAGVLITKPKIMLLDEPTNGLDDKTEEKLIEILKSIDKSMIIVSHKKEFLDLVAHRYYKLTKNGLKDVN